MADILRRNLINQCAKELSEYTTCSEFECQTIVANILSRNDAIEEMRGRQKSSTSGEALPIGSVGGSLRELADKYEMDALDRYRTGNHVLSHIHMAAQARYGFEDGWEAAKKQ
jgi:hypothetical protein